MRLIDADALKKDIETEWLTPQTKMAFFKIIDNAPTVEPKKEVIPVCKVTFDKEQLQEIVDEKVKEIIADCENCPIKNELKEIKKNETIS